MGAGALIDVMALTEAAREGAEVVLDGQNGDETLGFSKFLIADRLRQGRFMSARDLIGRWPLGRPLSRAEKTWILKEIGLKGVVPYRVGRVVRARLNRNNDYAAPQWLHPTLRRQFADLEDNWAWKTTGSGPLWWRHFAELVIEGPHSDLRMDYLRHRATAAGVRNESPLYDVDLIEYCLRLPPELAYDAQFNRPLAREAVRGILPEGVRLQEQKAVFSPFCLNMLTGADFRAIERLIIAPNPELGAYVDMDWVRNYWHTKRPGAGESSMGWGSLMWNLAAVEIWLRSHADPDFIDEMLALPDVPAPSIRRLNLPAGSTFFPLARAGQPA